MNSERQNDRHGTYEEIEKGVLDCFGELIEEYRSEPKAFQKETVMQGYLYCLLKQKMRRISSRISVERERETKLLYEKDEKGLIVRGFERNTENHKQLRKRGKKPKPGKIDFVIFYEKKDDVFIGIEIERPTKKGNESPYFENHIHNDSKKLKDYENKVNLKYLLCFGNLDSDVVESKLKNELRETIDGLKFAYIPPNKNVDLITIPEGWLKL